MKLPTFARMSLENLKIVPSSSVFGQTSLGIFAAPSVIETEVQQQYGVEIIGRLDEVRESFYAIAVERKLKHPAIVALSEAARQTLFGNDAAV